MKLTEALIKNTLPSHRQRILFAVSCCYEVWDLFSDDRNKIVVGVVERFADWLVSREEVANLSAEVYQGNVYLINNVNPYCPTIANFSAAISSSLAVYSAFNTALYACDAAATAVSACLHANAAIEYSNGNANPYVAKDRPIIRNQLRVLNSFVIKEYPQQWRTPNTQALAQQIYGNKQFDNMPILADALEECGCTDVELLNQLRDVEFPHYRGSYILEFLK